jgi:hypothetical protein
MNSASQIYKWIGRLVVFPLLSVIWAHGPFLPVESSSLARARARFLEPLTAEASSLAQSATVTPTVSSTPPPTMTLSITNTQTITPNIGAASPTAMAVPNCTTGSPFSFWRDRSVRASLGCPQAAPHIAVSVEETFQRGFMLWREDLGQIYVVYDNGSWAQYPRGLEDIYNENYDKEFSCESPASPPSPRRGFSKVWCAHYDVHIGLGNATEYEQGFCMDGGGDCETFQDFAHGFMYRSNRFNTLYLFLPDGTWKKE